MTRKILKISNVFRVLGDQNSAVNVLQSVSFSLAEGEFAVVMGPSGSGKSTLLGIAAGLDFPDSGEVILMDKNLGKESEESLAEMRLNKIGFIFQNFQLVSSLTAFENVSLPMLIAGVSAENIKNRTDEILQQTGMTRRKDHYPGQLSGGEEQRVAIGRAFVNKPKILFADEPTANLDYKNSSAVLDLMIKLNRENKSTLLVVTHDADVAKRADRVILLKEGRIASDKKNKKRTK